MNFLYTIVNDISGVWTNNELYIADKNENKGYVL